CLDDDQFVPQRLGRRLSVPCGVLVRRVPGVTEKADLCRRWHELVEQFDLFCRELAEQKTHPGDVVAWASEASDDAEPDRITTHPKDYGNCPGYHRLGLDD